MSVLATDTFNDVATTLLTAHTADTGQTWSLGSGQTNLSITGSNSVNLATSGVVGRNVLNVNPANADYSIEADINFNGATAQGQGLMVRTSAASEDGYLLFNDIVTTPGSTIWQLYWASAGAYTQIGTYTGAAASSIHAKLTAVGTTITVTIASVDRIVVTDANISAIGNPGLRCTTSNVDTLRSISNLTVSTATAATALPALFHRYQSFPRRRR